MTRFTRSEFSDRRDSDGLLFAGAAMADTLELKDGRVLTGRFLGGTQALMRFSVNGEVQTFNVTEIVALTFTSDYGNRLRRHHRTEPRRLRSLKPRSRLLRRACASGKPDRHPRRTEHVDPHDRRRRFENK